MHDLSVITQINSAAVNTLATAASGTTTKTINLTVVTSDFTIDSDGTIAAPVYGFKIKIGSPDIATAAGIATNPVELLLTLNVKHPCRNAVFTTQVIPDISSVVNAGPDLATMSPFVHTLEPSAYDCGLQSLTINEDSPFGYLYSAFMFVST